MRKVVVAMDSMKGCLDSLSASSAIASGLHHSLGSVETVCVPVADGGEGTAVALTYGKGGYRKILSKVTGPLGTLVCAEWYFDEATSTAFIDMASASGLALLNEKERNPLHTTSYGVGELIRGGVGAGARRILLGLGGSATVDAGLGACQALGLKIMDKAGNVIDVPFIGNMLPDVGCFEAQGVGGDYSYIELFLLCDVRARFTGKKGAARVFGPQKGASEKDVEFLESGMENVRKRIIDCAGLDLNDCPGSGAAGGAAGGLMAFAGGQIMNGAPLLLDTIGFDEIIKDADLIITGEGASDKQTLMGKLPYEILQRGKSRGIPVWLVAGRIRDREALKGAGFERIICINAQDIELRSNTVGENPMNPEVAILRLSSITI